MSYKTQSVVLQRIYLDNENPRHDLIDNEREIIAYLLGREQVTNLAKDIADIGLSPLDRLGVIPHPIVPNAFVTAEGNRRLCVLKLLSDPEKAPLSSQKRTFRALAKAMASPLETVEVVVFPDKEAARPWIARRHEGAMNGVGTRTWNARQKTRFDLGGKAKPNNPNVQATQLLDYAVANKLISADEHDKISLTTLTRFLSNPVFRNVIGLATTRDLSVNVPADQFAKVATRFLKDAFVGGKSGVTSRTSKKDREDYAYKLQKERIAPSSRLARATVLRAAADPSEEASGKKPRTRHSASPDRRSSVFDSSFVVQIKDRILKRIYDELRGLDCREYSFAAAYLLRAFIEQTARVFCKQFKLGHDAELHVLIGRVADQLHKEGVPNPQLKILRVMASDRDSRLSPETLGTWVHGAAIPSGSELARRGDTVDPLLRLILGYLK